FGVRKLEYIPTMITHFDQRNPARDPMRWLDVPKHVHDPAFASLRSKLRGTNARVTTAVDIDEALSHGVVEGG
ncbi:MAG: hypothetical protein ACRDP4_14180, partial [Nocardioidaceae bacterium]